MRFHPHGLKLFRKTDNDRPIMDLKSTCFVETALVQFTFMVMFLQSLAYSPATESLVLVYNVGKTIHALGNIENLALQSYF